MQEIPVINKQHNSGKILELTKYWTSPVPLWQPLKKSLNSSLRMACLLEDRLFNGLRFEGEVMLLTPANWKHLIKYGKPDFLLMESIWGTATGDWHMGQCLPSPHREELLQIVSFARKLSIPTVFWITKGHEYHEHYKDFARQFDFVFCADPMEVDLLRSEGVQAELLLPCVQPAMYNPFRLYEHFNAFTLGILYDGWADLDRMTGELSVLKKIKPYGLNIIESRYQIFRSRMNALPDYKDNILGCITEQNRILALKYAKAYTTFDRTLSTKTTQQWMTLEANASRLPVVHHGILTDDDFRKGAVVECPDQMEFLVEFIRFQEDALYRERIAHLGWRNANQNHSFAHRVQTICNKIGIKHDWLEYPKASLITPTFRREMLPRCLATYDRQNYPNKELIVVFNGADLPELSELGISPERTDVRLVHVPGEMFAGACLNYGHSHSSGEYCFRVDDDDHYGKNYVGDIVSGARSIDAYLCSKPPSAFAFEGEYTAYIRGGFPPFCVVSKELLKSGKVWLGGNSITGKRTFFTKNIYPTHSYGAADSAFMYNFEPSDTGVIAMLDWFNLIFERRLNGSSHTWRIDSDSLIASATDKVHIDDIMV